MESSPTCKYIVFWQNIVSPHQFPYIRRIPAIRPDWKVYLVVDSLGSRHRKEMGWNNYEAEQDENFEILVSPQKKKVDKLLNLPNALHLLGGLKGNSNYRRVIEAKETKPFKLGMISENIDLRGIRAVTRRLASWAIERPLRNHLDIVFCMGKTSVDWYRSCGYPMPKLVPFAYVVEPAVSIPCKDAQKLSVNVNPRSPKLEIIFIGSLITRKDVQLLLSAVSAIENSQFEDFHLTIVGDGPEATRLKSQSKQLGIGEKVDFLGIVPNSEVPELLLRHDVLVLPSQYDGWGAVVNEALHAGLFGIASDGCGASVLFEKHDALAPDLGSIFRRRSIRSLASALNGLSQSQINHQARSKRVRWAQENISPSVMAKYLCDSIDFKLYGAESTATPNWTLLQQSGDR